MKKSFYLHLQILVLILVIFGCSDKVVEEPTSTPPSNTPGNPAFTPPSPDKILQLTAGIDQLIFLPITVTHFTGIAFDLLKYKTDLKYEWKKINGPDKYMMDDSTKANPILSNLQTGMYEFVFTATTPDARFATDTVKIQVVQPVGEFVIPNLSWSCPMGCALQIQVRIPQDKPVHIYIKLDALPGRWEEVTNVYPTAPPYPTILYGIDKESLWIYADDQSGKCDVKIVFQ